MSYKIFKPEYRNSWALIVGINDYTHVSPLGYACNDAEAVSRVLMKQFDFPQKNIKLLLNSEATKETILKEFLDFSNVTENDDRIFVFFAGHGNTIVGYRGDVGYLVPVDGKTDELSTLIRWDSLTIDADLISAKHILFIMDACYGGLAITRSLPPGSNRFLKDMLQRYSRQVLTAGKADETVSDAGGPRPGHSVFTGHLIEALEGAAATSDGILTANGIMSYVYQKVAKDIHSQQTPHYGFLGGDGDFIFQAPQLKNLTKDLEADKDILVEVPHVMIEAISQDENIAKVTKEYLSEQRSRIKLEDFVKQKLRATLTLLSEDHFPVEAPSMKPEELAIILKKYETSIKDIQEIIICLSYWGQSEHSAILRMIQARMIDHVNIQRQGVVIQSILRWYPVILLMYSSGIASIAAQNYDNLAIALTTKISIPYQENGKQECVLHVGKAILELTRMDIFKLLPGHGRHFVPRSEYLFKLLQPVMEDLLFLGRDYETFFDYFEIILALVHSDRYRTGWAPLGRFAWKHRNSIRENSPLIELFNEAETSKNDWPLVKVRLFRSYESFSEIATELEANIRKLSWH